jgi:hypothetical protein
MQSTIIIRSSTDRDAAAIARLAELDSRPAPSGRVLLALVDGELRAALSLAGGELIANPFKPSQQLAALLRLRASHERAGSASERPDRGLRRPLWPRRVLSRRPGAVRA